MKRMSNPIRVYDTNLGVSDSIFNRVLVIIHDLIEQRVLFVDAYLVQVGTGLYYLQDFVSCVDTVEDRRSQYRVCRRQCFGMGTKLFQRDLVRFLQIGPTLVPTKCANDFEVAYYQSIDIHTTYLNRTYLCRVCDA